MSKEIIMTPEQQVCVDYRGVTAKNLVIQGVAGSGKSTVLMGRAHKFLSDGFIPGKSNQVIIFTYNNTLVNYLQDLFKIDISKNDSVKITTLDAFLTEVYFYTKGSNRKNRIEDRFRKRYMQQALDAHKSKYGAHRLHNAGVDFWIEECLWMRDMNISISDFDIYRTMPRKGRGGKVKIFDSDREIAFQIYLAYTEQLDKKYLCEASDRYLFLSHNLSRISDRFKYDHVLIDEAQDQSLTKMLIVAALSKQDATISMDMNQRIYKQNWTMKQLGLPSITKTLKRGMRCSPEILALAKDLILHNKEAVIDTAPAECKPGPLPIVQKVSNEYEMKRTLIEHLKDWTKQDPTATFGVLGAKNKLVEQYGSWFTDAGMTYELIKPSERFSVDTPGIKLSTVHSAKGLEFTHVIIPEFDEDIYPWPIKTDDTESIDENLQDGRNRTYVAMTRAKKQLLILCGAKPSRFVAELNPELFRAIGFSPSKPMQESITQHPVTPKPPVVRVVENRNVVTANPVKEGKIGHFHIDTKHYPAHKEIVGKTVGDHFVVGGNEYVITAIEGKAAFKSETVAEKLLVDQSLCKPHPEPVAVLPKTPAAEGSSTFSVAEILRLMNEGMSGDEFVGFQGDFAGDRGRKNASTASINYDEIDTAKNLYDKYHNFVDDPFIIVRNTWHGDYCFVVDEFWRNNTWVRGRTFRNGIFDRSTSYHADAKEFRMYNGPSKDIIKAKA